jgi:hypothetical protein
MSLGYEQRKFTEALGKLIIFAYEEGYQLSLGDAWGAPGDGRHRRGSFHYKRLAIDLNLFRCGKYLRKTSDHEFLGKYWESLGGTWGGRFSKKDGNHYSWGEGRKKNG